MPKVAPFPYVGLKYSKLSHVTYFRLHLLVMTAYLTFCLSLPRRIRLYQLDFGVFVLFCSYSKTIFTAKLPPNGNFNMKM